MAIFSICYSTCGACGCSGGIFHDLYGVWGGADKILPIDLYIPGCQPTPLATIATHGGPNQRDSSGRPGLQMAAMMWPTPTTSEAKSDTHNLDNRLSKGKQFMLCHAVRMWPTPRANKTSDENEESWLVRNAKGHVSTPPLALAVKLATPQARDFRTGQTSRWENPDRTRNLNDQIGGQLNPTWVEWLMGWPLGWTDLRHSATDKFQQWLRSHGRP
jgi:hypothetical protein